MLSESPLCTVWLCEQTRTQTHRQDMYFSHVEYCCVNSPKTYVACLIQSSVQTLESDELVVATAVAMPSCTKWPQISLFNHSTWPPQGELLLSSSLMKHLVRHTSAELLSHIPTLSNSNATPSGGGMTNGAAASFPCTDRYNILLGINLSVVSVPICLQDHPQGGCKLRKCHPTHLCLLVAATL